MLDQQIIDKIEKFVYNKPRSVFEIAQFLGKNWRTADRYINEIEKEFGTISTRVFRQGTRGALKIVFWSSMEKASSSTFQQQLEKEIIRAKRKEDFSAFDIYQYIQEKSKNVKVKLSSNEEKIAVENLAEPYLSAKKQLFIFSGNLSFINFSDGKIDMFSILDDLVKKGVSIKILCRVDIAGKKNIEKMLSLNFKHGKESVEIRHKEHPLRATVFDNSFFHIKEIKEPTGKIHELDKKIFIFYTIKDKEWTEWMSRIFWKLFSSSIDANKRIKELNNLA